MLECDIYTAKKWRKAVKKDRTLLGYREWVTINWESETNTPQKLKVAELVTRTPDKNIHEYGRFGSFGWVTEAIGVEVEGVKRLVIVYNTTMLGHGVGNIFYAPENNGLAVIDKDGNPLAQNIMRQASGYFGPSSDQLVLLEDIQRMYTWEFKAWARRGFPSRWRQEWEEA